MKRCSTLLIALVLLVALFPASSALAACNHDTDYGMEHISARYGYTPIPGNSNKHLVTCYNTWACRACGKIILYDEPWYTEEKSHNFNSYGKCTQCGYQKSSSSSCYHTRTKEVAGEKKYEIIEGNDRQHRVVTNYNTVCSQCNKILSTDKKTQVAAHAFSGNTCTVCGYTKASTTTKKPSATATPKHEAEQEIYPEEEFAYYVNVWPDPVQTDLPNGQKIKVFTGPDRSKPVAINGTARLNTNKPFDVWGYYVNWESKEKWYLVRYQTDNHNGGIGFINENDFMGSIDCEELTLDSVWSIPNDTIFITDDPDGSQRALMFIMDDQPYTTYLATYKGATSDWYFIQYSEFDYFTYGFVPAYTIERLTGW